MKKAMIGVMMLLLASTSSFAADYVKPSDIQKVNLGDTFDQVSQKIGEPQQVLSKTLDAQGKEQVVWLYEAIAKPNTRISGFLPTGATPQDALLIEKKYEIERTSNPPYLIIFTDGKASNVKRQELRSSDTAKIDVISY